MIKTINLRVSDDETETVELLSNQEGFNNLLKSFDTLPPQCQQNEAEVVQQLLQQRQRKHIFTDGLPRMGPICDSTKFTSNPSIPSDDKHKKASLRDCKFEILSALSELSCPEDNIWNGINDDRHLGGYSDEAGANIYVLRVIRDVLNSIKVERSVSIRAEIEVMRNRPDFMLILRNGHRIGTVEGTQPGNGAMDHPNILGEVYDQLQYLQSIFRVDNPFAILT